jgi:murein DD-endopeptidase MepM/ murein hydrolase activator NlpD
MKLKILLLSLLLPSIAGADTAWPGGIAFLDLGRADGEPPVVEFDGKRVLVMNSDGQWRAAVGVPLSAAAGRASVTFDNGITMSFDVVEHAYAEEHLQVAKSYVSLSEEDLARYHRERKVIDAALNNWRDVPLTGVTLESPVEGPRSSSFGKRRFFNNEPRNPHTGMDIAVPEGTPIKAPRGGMVTETGDFYFNGNSVFIDHGQGFVTMYCHLSEIDVEKGQQVSTGDVIGLVGKTGRVTGAHLHFGTYLNGNAVDPALLITDSQ